MEERTHLYESIVLLVIEMNGNNGLVTFQTQSHQILSQPFVTQQPHFGHLGVEEMGKSFFRRFRRDVSNVESARLAGERTNRSSGSDCSPRRSEEERRGIVSSERAGNGGGIRPTLSGEVEHA